MTRARLLQRLDRLIERVRPAHSLAARVAKLPDHLCARYTAWATAEHERIARLEAEGPGAAYAANLDETHIGEAMPRILAGTLGLTPPTIPADASGDDAAEIYQRYKDR